MVVPPFPELREVRNFTLTATQPLDTAKQVKETFAPGTPTSVTLSLSEPLFADGCVN